MNAAPAAAIEGGTQAGLSALTNQGGIAALQNLGTNAATDAVTQAAIEGGTQAGLGAFNPYAGLPTGTTGGLGFDQLQTLSAAPSVTPSVTMQDLSGTTLGKTPVNLPVETTPKVEKSFLEKATDVASKTFYDENKGVKLGNVAAVGLPALTYLSGAFEREPFKEICLHIM
jgi:hypothetical protein